MGEMTKRIKDHLLDQTLLHDGATVLNPFGIPCVPLTGYVVGRVGFMFDLDTLQPVLWNGAMELVEQQLGPLMIGPTRGVGTWKCGDDVNTHVHVDAVQWTNSEQHARLLCAQYNQQAFYDVEKEVSVYVRVDPGQESQAFVG